MKSFNIKKKRSSTQKCLICLITKLLTNILQALRFFFPGQNKNLDKFSNFTVLYKLISPIYSPIFTAEVYIAIPCKISHPIYTAKVKIEIQCRISQQKLTIYIYFLIFTAKVTIEIIQIQQ